MVYIYTLSLGTFWISAFAFGWFLSNVYTHYKNYTIRVWHVIVTLTLFSIMVASYIAWRHAMKTMLSLQ